MASYDNIGICTKCGGDNFITVEDTIGRTIAEAETRCNTCDHLDYWSYGFMMSKSERKEEF